MIGGQPRSRLDYVVYHLWVGQHLSQSPSKHLKSWMGRYLDWTASSHNYIRISGSIYSNILLPTFSMVCRCLLLISASFRIVLTWEIPDERKIKKGLLKISQKTNKKRNHQLSWMDSFDYKVPSECRGSVTMAVSRYFLTRTWTVHPGLSPYCSIFTSSFRLRPA